MNACFFHLPFFLMGACLLANGQDKQPVSPLPQPAPSFIEKHRNPDYRELSLPPARRPGSGNRLFRGKPVRPPDVYAVPFGSYEAENLTQNPANNVRFGLTPDGRWLIVRPNYSGVNTGALLLREGLDYPTGPPERMHKSFSIIQQ